MSDFLAKITAQLDMVEFGSVITEIKLDFDIEEKGLEDVEKEKISASVDNGVLNIELPKITQEEKKQANRVIEIK